VIEGRKKLVNEFYDEIIFHEPSQFFYNLLNTNKLLTNGIYKHDTDCIAKKFSSQNKIFKISNFNKFQVKEKENQTLEKIQSAKAKVRNEIRELKDRIKLTQDKIQLLKEKVESEDLVVEDAI
jgi:YEATS domain-containing protein 4